MAGTGTSADAMTAARPADRTQTYALNLSTVFTGLPFLERFDAAAAAGFAAVEFWWPREEFRSGLTPKALVTRVLDVGIGVALMNFDGGDLGAGERGFAGVPGRDESFRRGVPMALDLADRLKCHRLHALAGRRAPGHRLEDQLRLLESSLAFAADLAPAGTTITLEVLNSTDVPGYLVPGQPIRPRRHRPGRPAQPRPAAGRVPPGHGGRGPGRGDPGGGGPDRPRPVRRRSGSPRARHGVHPVRVHPPGPGCRRVSRRDRAGVHPLATRGAGLLVPRDPGGLAAPYRPDRPGGALGSGDSA